MVFLIQIHLKSDFEDQVLVKTLNRAALLSKHNGVSIYTHTPNAKYICKNCEVVAVSFNIERLEKG